MLRIAFPSSSSCCFSNQFCMKLYIFNNDQNLHRYLRFVVYSSSVSSSLVSTTATSFSVSSSVASTTSTSSSVSTTFVSTTSTSSSVSNVCVYNHGLGLFFGFHLNTGMLVFIHSLGYLQS